MKDIDKLKELLDSFGVEYQEQDPIKGCIEITTQEGYNKVSGYSGFITYFSFDMNGDFVEMGAYE